MTQCIKSLDDRFIKLEELSEEIGMLSRKLELEVTKKYQTSRKTIYGVDNELHLVEQIQKALTMIYENTDKEDFRSSIVITLEKLIKRNNPVVDDSIKEAQEVEPHEKELELSEQMHLVLKLAMNLKSISKDQEVRDFFFARFKRQLYKKNIVDLIQ